MQKFYTRCAIIAAVSGAATVGYSEAQAETDFLLEEITVTASLEPIAIESTGSTVAIVDVEEAVAPSLTFSGLLNRVSGINFSEAGGIGTETSVRVRGLPSYYLGTRIDGINVVDPSRPQLSFNFGPLMASGIRRIEVLKGSQSALYGSETAAGLIEITSWRPEKTGKSGQMNAEFGSHETFSGTISTGIKDERSEIALTFGRTVTNGISARSTDATGETDAYRGSQVNFSAKHEVNELVSIGFSAISQRSFAEFDESVSSADGWSRDSGKGVRVFTELNYNNISHLFSASMFASDRTYFQYDDLSYYDGGRRLIEYKSNLQLSEALSLGVFAEKKVEDFSFSMDYIDYLTNNLVLVNENGEVTTNALGSELRFASNAKTDISLALRRDVHSLFGNQDSSRLAGSWRPAESLTLRGAAALGYRSPSPYELWSSYGDESLMPEESRSIELGAEFNTDEFLITATVFDVVINNQVIFDDVDGSYRQFEGDATTRGLEASAEVYFASGWTAFGSYSYTAAKVNDDLGTRRGVRTPRHQLALGIEGSIIDRLSGSLSVKQVKDLWDETYVDLDLDYIPDLVQQEQLPDYVTANISLSYEMSDTLNGYLRVDNAFNQTYETIKGFSQPGRTVFLGVQSSF
jgi:vitamin B12 transporter